MCRQKTIYGYLTSGRVTTKNILKSRKMLRGQNDEHQGKLTVTIMVTLTVAVIMA